MTYSVLVGSGGYTGWKTLERTAEYQRLAVSQDPQIQVSRDYFFSGFEKISSSDDLVSDFRILKVVLTAFGLDDDIKNRAFIKKVLDSDITDTDSFANKLSDKRYLEMAKSLSFSQAEPDKDGAEIFDLFVEKTFHARVGESDENLRLALNAKSEIPALSKKYGSENAFWYSVMGSKPLRAVFEKAFGLPASFGQLSLDRQLSEFKDKAVSTLGSSAPNVVSEEANVDKIIRNFLLRSQISSNASSNRFSVALALLS